MGRLNLKSDMSPISVHPVAPACNTSIWLHLGFPGIGIASLLLCRARTLRNLIITLITNFNYGISELLSLALHFLEDFTVTGTINLFVRHFHLFQIN